MGRSGSVLQVKDKEKLVQEIRIAEICQVNVMGNIQITTQAIQSLCDAGVPVCYYSQGGWFYGITTGLNTKNVFLRMAQFALANSAWFPLKVARKLVAGKIRNQRTMLLRNHLEPPTVLQALKELIGNAENARALDELLGLEGYAHACTSRNSWVDQGAGRRGRVQLRLSPRATAARPVIRSTRCCRWPTVSWPRT